MAVKYRKDSIQEIREKEALEKKIEQDKATQMEDIDAMLVDLEYRLTLMELKTEEA